MLADDDRAVVARDPALPGLANVLDPASCLPGDPVVRYVKYKPGRSCLVGVEDLTGRRHTLKAVRPEGLLAGHRAAAAVTPGPGRQPQALAGTEAVSILPFPEDTRLRGPRWLLDPVTADRARARLRLPDANALAILAWKPERRTVFRADGAEGPVATVKCHTAASAAHARAVATLCEQLPFHAPRLLRASERRATLAYAWISGRTLTHANVSMQHIAAAGRFLAALHGTRADQVSALPRLAPEARDARLRASLVDLDHLVPGMAAAALSVLDQVQYLRATNDANDRLIHGDFYIKQLLDADGGLACLDFDDAAQGHPLDDVGVFLAHVERDAARGAITADRAAEISGAFLDAYGLGVDAARSATAYHMLGLLHHPFRHRAVGWVAETRALLDRARALLGRTHGAIARRLAADPALAFAAPALDPTAATNAARQCRSTADVVVVDAALRRHKPGRRALVSWRLLGPQGPEQWLVKVRARGTDERTAALHRALRARGLDDTSPHGVSVPEVIGTMPAWHAVAQRTVGGRTLFALLRDGGDAADAGARVALALDTLHDAGVRATRGWHLDDELTMLRPRFDALRLARPALGAPLVKAWDRLVRVAAPLRLRPARHLVHRDFYHDQVLLDGARTWIVDLDCCAQGDPAMDVGNVVAHLIECAWRGVLPAPVVETTTHALIDHTTRSHPSPAASADAIARWTLLSLARVVEIARHHDDRREHVPALLDRLLLTLSRRGGTPPHALLEVAS